MRILRKTAAFIALVALSLAFLPTTSAKADIMNMRIAYVGAANSVTNGDINLGIEFSGGLGSTASNCVALVVTASPRLIFSFTAGAKTTTFDSLDFDITDKAVASDKITCDFKLNRNVADFTDNQEQMPLTVRAILGTAEATVSTVIYNPLFPGELKIASPSRGQTLSGFADVAIQSSPGTSRTLDSLSIQACPGSCQGADNFVQVFPSFQGATRSETGLIARGGSTYATVVFDRTGLTEIQVEAKFGKVVRIASVLINVAETKSQVEMPWTIAKPVVDAGLANLTPKVSCNTGNLSASGVKNCSVSLSSDDLITNAPVTIFTRSNGATWNQIKTLILRTSTEAQFSVKYAGSPNTFEVGVTVSNTPSARSSIATFGTSAPKLTLTAPKSVKAGQSFYLKVRASKKVSGECTLIKHLGTQALYQQGSMFNGVMDWPTYISLDRSAIGPRVATLEVLCSFYYSSARQVTRVIVTR